VAQFKVGQLCRHLPTETEKDREVN